MDWLKILQQAINNDEDGAIDALLFITKIETLKEDSTQSVFNKAKSMVKNFYNRKYNNPYSKDAILLYSYIGKEIDKEFYNLNEITIEDDELITDKIIRRMKEIRNSACSLDYKWNSLIFLNMYLKELSPNDFHPEAGKMVVRLYLRNLAIKLFNVFLLALAIWLPKVVYYLFEKTKGNPKELIYHEAIKAGTVIIILGTIILYTYLTEFCHKKGKTFMVISFLIFSIILTKDYIVDIRTDIKDYPSEIITIENIVQAEKDGNVVKVVVKLEDESKKELISHSNLGLEYDKKYIIKYNKSNIIIDAEEIN